MTYVDCPRLPRPVEMPARRAKQHPYEPDTQAEHDSLSLAFRKGVRARRHLEAFYNSWKDIPPEWRREIAGHISGLPLEDAEPQDHHEFGAVLDDMEAALDNSEFGA